MDDRLRPQSDRNPGAAETDSAAPADPPESSRPTAVIVVGISDSIADVLGRFPGYPGHEVRLTIPPGSALFLTAVRVSRPERSKRPGRHRHNGRNRRSVATPTRPHVWPNTHHMSAPTVPRLVTHAPGRSPSSAQPTAAPTTPGQIISLPTNPPAGASGRSFEIRGANPPGPDSYVRVLLARSIVRPPGPAQSKLGPKTERLRHLRWWSRPPPTTKMKTELAAGGERF